MRLKWHLNLLDTQSIDLNSGYIDKKTICFVFSINKTHYLNKQIGVVIMAAPIRSDFLLP